MNIKNILVIAATGLSLMLIALGFSYLNLSQENTNLRDRTNLAETKYYESSIDKDTYQAVFLDNDQVYFGKISGIDEQFIRLNDVYYLQGEDGTSVVKLGKELHGPKDPMFISQNKVLFWENLRTDSEVVKNIRNVDLNIN